MSNFYKKILFRCLLLIVTVRFISFPLNFIVSVVSVEDVQFFSLSSLFCTYNAAVLCLNLVIGSLHCYIVTPLQCNEMCPSGNLLSFYALYGMHFGMTKCPVP